MPLLRDEERVFPLGGGFSVLRSNRPMIARVDNPFPNADVDHRLNGKGHPGGHQGFDSVVVMGHFGRFVERESDSMGDELVDDGAGPGRGIFFDYISDTGDRDSGLADGNRPLQTFKRDFDGPPLLFGDIPDHHHLARIAEESIDDGGDVDVDDISLLKGSFVGNSVANHFVDRSADRLCIGGMAIAEVGRDSPFLFMEFAREFIERLCSHSGFRMFAKGVENFGCHLAGAIDFFYLLWSFEKNPILGQIPLRI